jgi:hypothetical protein
LFTGANINDVNNLSETPLHWATKKGHLKTLKLLLDNGASVNARDITGSTALHSAARYGIPEALPFLIDSGADIEIPDNDGLTVAQLASQGQTDEHRAFLTLLRRLKSNCSTQSFKESKHSLEFPPLTTQTGNESRFNVDEKRTSKLKETHLNRVHSAKSLTHQIIRKASSKTSLSLIKPSLSPLGFLTSAARSSPFLSHEKGSLPEVAKDVSTQIYSEAEIHHVDLSFGTAADEANGQRLLEIRPIKGNSFLPRTAQKYDVVISVEQCSDCSNHSSSLWHDESRYDAVADRALTLLARHLLDCKFPVRLFGFKQRSTRAEDKSRLGALEISLAIKYFLNS